MLGVLHGGRAAAASTDLTVVVPHCEQPAVWLNPACSAGGSSSTAENCKRKPGQALPVSCDIYFSLSELFQTHALLQQSRGQGKPEEMQLGEIKVV